MELLDTTRSTVVVIDLQGKLMEMVVRPKLLVEASVRLLKLADLFKVPVVLTEQYPKGIGPSHPRIQQAFDALTTEKRFLEKTSFGCCGDSAFVPLLQSLHPDLPPAKNQIVIAGIEAHVCVLGTVIELRRLGYQVYVCWECVTGRGEEYRRHALDRMVQAGAVLTNHESVAFEWARDKNHPAFKAVNNLFKEGQLVE